MATTEFFGIGSVVVGVFDKDPVVPRLPDKFLLFKGHYTLRNFTLRMMGCQQTLSICFASALGPLDKPVSLS